jgi:hypothetical protein
MHGTGNLSPTLFPIGHDGKQVMPVPENLADVEARHDFATVSKRMAVPAGATISKVAGAVAHQVFF